MKIKFFIVLICLFINILSGVCQRSKEINNFSKTENQEIENYVISSKKLGYLIDGKGVVGLYSYLDSLEQLNWIIGIEMDDRYLENVPSGWLRVKNSIILIYQVYIDAWWDKGNLNESEIAFFEDLLHDRLTKRRNILDKVGDRNFTLGDNLNVVHYTFLKNGRIDRN